MTDKQIAAAYLARRLWGMLTGPDYDELRDFAGAKLTEARCARIAERIGAMLDKMRAPLVEYLNRTGQETA